MKGRYAPISGKVVLLAHFARLCYFTPPALRLRFGLVFHVKTRFMNKPG